ncbi:MAG: alpha/beta hydrolase [Bacteroidota bacterium]
MITTNVKANKIAFKIHLLFAIGLLNINAQEVRNVKGPIEYSFDSSKETELKAFVFMPDEINPVSNYPAIVIFHGGGWSIGDPSWAFGIAEKYARKGLVAVAAQYRLSDQKSITPVDAMEDARNAILWMRENSIELRIDKERIAAYGWSAGAHLAACAAVFYSANSEKNINSIPNALVLVSPGLSIINDNWFKQLLMNESDPYICSPAENLKENMPPSIIVVGKDDTVTPIFGSNLFHQNMLKHGNRSQLFIYDGVGHLFTPSDQPDDGYPNPDKETQSKAYDEIDKFLKELKYIE